MRSRVIFPIGRVRVEADTTARVPLHPQRAIKPYAFVFDVDVKRTFVDALIARLPMWIVRLFERPIARRVRRRRQWEMRAVGASLVVHDEPVFTDVPIGIFDVAHAALDVPPVYPMAPGPDGVAPMVLMLHNRGDEPRTVSGAILCFAEEAPR